MKRPRWFVLLSAILAVIALCAALLLSLDYETVVVEYTASLDGHLDGCSCWGAPIGGLVKRAVRYRGDRDSARPDLLLDAGNILSPGTDPELSTHILETYRELGYDLVALGDQELSDGSAAVERYLREYPLRSHNLSLPDREREERALFHRVGAVTVAVISLTGEEAFGAYPRELRQQFDLRDPVVAATRALAGFEAPDYLLLLYHGNRRGAERLASAIPGVDAVIYGRDQEVTDTVLPNGTRLLSPGEQGNRVGRLTLRSRRGLFSSERVRLGVKNRFIFFNYLEEPDDPAVRERIVAYEAAREATIESTAVDSSSHSRSSETLKVLYYYSPGCKECREFLKVRAPAIVSALPFSVDLRRRNILNPAVYEEFEALLRRSGRRSDEFPLLVVESRTLQGSDEIDAHLEDLLLAYGEGREPVVGELLPPPGTETPNVRLSLLPVMAAGLLDGINPCVFTALIFLTSSLLLLRKERGELLLLGGTFVATVYITYFLLGLGMLAGLRVFAGFPGVAQTFRYLLGAILLFLALSSLRDAWFARSGETGRMALRLPKRVEERIHREIRLYRNRGAMVGGTIAIAVLITVLELGCTGQIYLPTLAYYARSSIRAASLLAAYNLAFVVPLLALFAAVVTGVSTTRIRRLFQSGLPAVKVASALLFGTFAVMMVFF